MIFNPTAEIAAGANAPFRILHITDTHLAYADGRDDERKQSLAADRRSRFDIDSPSTALDCYRESLRYAKENGMLTVHTGDLLDFVSEQLLEMTPGLIREAGDAIFAAGNHEFSLYVGEAFEDGMYRARSFDRVSRAFAPNDLNFSSRVVNGVNLVALDNSYYYVTSEQFARFREEVGRGLPIILFVHTPFYTPELYDYMMETLRETDCAAVAVPEEKLANYTDHRYRQQVATPQTRKFVEYLYSTPLLKAVVAGHLHHPHESKLPNGVMQYVTEAQYRGAARIIEVV